jgi:acyl-CoA synthetase (AMP-forming)/AMP-acid ligase II
VEVPQGEPGEFYTHHGMLIDGYYKDDEATQESLHGKYMTVGDMAMQDEDGYYFIVDRKNDMIIRAGVNIYPAEVETVLSRMPGVADIAVVGVPDEHWGEIVAAFVVLEKGSKVTEEDIKEFGRGEMTHYLIPEVIEFIDELPRTPTGKVLKKNLRAEMKLKRV